tara:strand:+ start:600 stop:836 length:237 start_codon:yes stop_codon:yes gene_type:complete
MEPATNPEVVTAHETSYELHKALDLLRDSAAILEKYEANRTLDDLIEHDGELLSYAMMLTRIHMTLADKITDVTSRPL